MAASRMQDRLHGTRRRAVWALVLVNIFIAVHINAAAPTWARAAVALKAACDDASPPSIQRIPSPDKTATVEIDCRRSAGGYEPIVRVIFSAGPTQTLALTNPSIDYWRPQELLWSPDSKAFLINGSENGYAGFGVVVYELRSASVVAHDVTRAAQNDMVATFPPCRALNADDSDCKRMEADPEFNMSALTWTQSSTFAPAWLSWRELQLPSHRPFLDFGR